MAGEKQSAGKRVRSANWQDNREGKRGQGVRQEQAMQARSTIRSGKAVQESPISELDKQNQDKAGGDEGADQRPA